MNNLHEIVFASSDKVVSRKIRQQLSLEVMGSINEIVIAHHFDRAEAVTSALPGEDKDDDRDPSPIITNPLCRYNIS